MARTSGHGNPRWTRDETILALDLLLRAYPQVPRPEDERVIALSNLLKQNPFYERSARQPSFRNPDGVSFKLQNLRQVATGEGLEHTSKMDRVVWNEFGHSPELVRQLASRIQREIETFSSSEDSPAEELEFPEGKLITRAHRNRERSAKLRKAVLKSRRQKGPLNCDACETKACSNNPDLEDAIFEVHHTIPLGEVGEVNTRLADTVLLCANCHRLIHRMISQRKKWVTVDELRQALN